MLSITVEFLHGTYRADSDGGAITGRSELGEWPPAVTRLLAAFVAADGMGGECRVTDGTELRFMEGLGAPVIHAEAAPEHRVLQPRFVVRASGPVKKDGKDYPAGHQEYPARKGAEVRPGVRVSLRHRQVVFSWDAHAPAHHLQALRIRAARIGYLGCADSPVRVRVRTDAAEAIAAGLHAFRPDRDGTTLVSVPRAGEHLEALSAAYEAWRENGPSTNRSQFPMLRNVVAYSGPDDRVGPHDPGRVVAWLRLRPSLPGRRVADITAALRLAMMSRYERLFGITPPRELHGHGFDGTGYEIARYLALPNVGFEHSDGRIHGLAVWMPKACQDEVMDHARAAARSIDVLHGTGIRAQVSPWEGETKPAAANPRRWQGRSRAWATAVPAIHERFRKLDADELRRWCAHAGLPEPQWFRSTRVPTVKGALNLHPTKVHRSASKRGRTTKPYSHLVLRFAEPVRGPVVVGGGRSRGFGLCVPVDDTHGRLTASGEARSQ